LRFWSAVPSSLRQETTQEPFAPHYFDKFASRYENPPFAFLNNLRMDLRGLDLGPNSFGPYMFGLQFREGMKIELYCCQLFARDYFQAANCLTGFALGVPRQNRYRNDPRRVNIRVSDIGLQYTLNPPADQEQFPAFLVYDSYQHSFQLPPFSSSSHFYLARDLDDNWFLYFSLPSSREKKILFWERQIQRGQLVLILAFQSIMPRPDLAWRGEQSWGIKFFREETSEIKDKLESGYLLTFRYD
jgi:hypothetical protein